MAIDKSKIGSKPDSGGSTERFEVMGSRNAIVKEYGGRYIWYLDWQMADN